MAIAIRQGQTYSLAIDSEDGVRKATVTIRQGDESFDVSNAKPVHGKVVVTLSDKDTLSMRPGAFEMQARCSMEDGGVVMSPIYSGVVLESLSKEAANGR